MKHAEGNFKGSQNLTLYYQSWQPPQKPKAILLVVHGLAEHGGRYLNLVNHFVPKGYAVYCPDHRGHGRSEGQPGYVERFSYYTDDLKTFFDIVRGQHSDAKIFMVGHSMGGTIATAYATQHQDGLAGLILSGAGLRAADAIPPALIIVVRIIALLLPKTGVANLDAADISRDKTVVDAYVNDPLVYRGKLSARFGAEFARTMQKLPHQMKNITLPILIMHGTADRLVSPEGSRMLYERVSSQDKTLKLYDGLYHEIFNEPEHEQVLREMEMWLEARL